MDFLALLYVVLIPWGLNGAGPLADPMNHPPLFYGKGWVIHFALNTVITLSAINAIVWMFLTLNWYEVPPISLLGVMFGMWLYKKLPLALIGNVIGFVATCFILPIIGITVWLLV